MIVPISTQSICIGDKVVTIKEISSKYCIITIGHEFDVVDYDKKIDQFVCEDITKSRFHINKNCLTKKVSFELAKKEYTFKDETSKYKTYISKKCPNKSEDYDDREIYDSCKLKTCYNNCCEPLLECAKYLTKEDINKSTVLLKHLRNSKIKKLNELC